jgi:hypothetical protein
MWNICESYDQIINQIFLDQHFTVGSVNRAVRECQENDELIMIFKYIKMQ